TSDRPDRRAARFRQACPIKRRTIMAFTMNKTWDDARLRKERISRLQEEMGRRNLGALWIRGVADLWYVLGTRIPSGTMFVPREGEAIAFVRPRDAGYVRKHFSTIRPPLVERKIGRA